MSRIRSQNTNPERIVRSFLHGIGYRFRLYRKDLPGKPDIVLHKYKTVIDVRGCYWHRHQGCKKATSPKTNEKYWTEKFNRNVERDNKNKTLLESNGWNVIIIWECEAQNDILKDIILKRLKKIE